MADKAPICPRCGKRVWTYKERGAFYAEFIFGEDVPDETEFVEGDDDHSVEASSFDCRVCGWTTEHHGIGTPEEAEQETTDALYELRDSEITRWRFK